MVASLLRLRALGLANRIVRPRSRAEQVTSLIVGLAGIAAVVGIVLLSGFGAETTPELRHAAFVAVGSIVVAAFWIVPFVVRTTAGVDPRAFVPFPIAPGRLALALAVSSLLSLPALLLVLLLVGYVAAWAEAGPGAVLAAVGASVLVLVIAVLGSLIAGTIASDGIMWRNAGGVAALAAVAVLAPLLALVDWGVLGFTYLRRIADALAWTPFGVAWSVPGDAALGRTAEAWLHVAAAVLLVAVLWLVWVAVVRRGASRRPPRADEQVEVGLGAFDVLPDTQAGVVAARSITYWLRDARYVVPLLILPLVPAGIVLAFWLAGIPWSVIVWLPVPLVSLLIGWSIHNDVAADGTAFWLHVVTSVRGRADRWGRVVIPLVLGLVVAIVGGVVSAALHGDDAIAAPLVALSVCALLAGLGVSSVASAVAPYPTVHPGDSPFQQPQGAGGTGMTQILSLIIAAAACLPVVAAIVAANAGGGRDFTTAVVLGWVLGPVLLIVGVELGAFAMRRRAPELLAFTQQN